MLREMIDRKGLKQRFMAAKLGVSEVTISNWVKGKSHPNEDHLIRLAELLEVPIEKLRESI